MKETYYFPHDYNARNDPKLQKVLMKLGQSGKGLYWDLVEMLYEEGGYLMLSECESYAFTLRSELSCLTSLINDFELFQKDTEKFWSESVLRRLNHRKSKSKTAADNAFKRWNKASPMQTHCKPNANALQTECKGNAIKERKGKEIKGKESKVNVLLEKEPKESEFLEFENSDALTEKKEGKEKEKSRAKKEKEKRFLLFDTPEFEQAFDEYLILRKTLKKPLLELSHSRFFEKLNRLSRSNEATAIAILNQSVDNGWQGVFELKPVIHHQQSKIQERVSTMQQAQSLWKYDENENRIPV